VSDACGLPLTVSREAVPEPETLRWRIGKVVVDRSNIRRVAASALAAVMAGDQTVELSEGAVAASAASSEEALLRGALLHRLLQHWDFRSDVEPLIRSLLRGACLSLEQRRVLAPYLKGRALQFRDSPVGRHIGTGAARREQPFSLRLDDALVFGVVDVLLEDDTIVDYKTGHPSSHLHAQYEWQVRLYALALSRLRDRTPPAALLYYVDSGASHEVDISAARLAETLQRAQDAIALLRAPG